MATYYRIPKKRKYCLIIYNNHVYQTKEDLLSQLLKQNYSAYAANAIVENICKNSADSTVATEQLAAMGLDSKVVNKYISGIKVK